MTLDFLLSIALAVLPGIVLAMVMYLKDHHEPEPVRILILAFGLGAGAFMISLIPGELLELYVEDGVNRAEVRAFHAFATVACMEELCKFLVVRFILYPNRHFNEPMDGIVYTVMVGLGFASLENVVYVFRDGMESGILRMFSAIPAHAMFAVVMGYYLGIARFTHRRETFFALLGLLIAVLLHGSYDYFLFISFIPGMWLGAVFSLLIAAWMAWRSIRIHQQASPFRSEEQKK